MGTTFVVDACVAAKWLLPAVGEGLLEQANRLLALHVKREIELTAPELIEAEIGNVLWKAVRRDRVSRSAAEHSLRHFRALGVEVIPSSAFLGEALRISLAYDRSLYDCLYVALAVTTKTELITADEPLVNVLGSRFPVRWLGAFRAV